MKYISLIMKGLEFKEKRKNLGLTQDELAKELGVSRKTINTYENSEYIPEAKQQMFQLFFNSKSNKMLHIENESLEPIFETEEYSLENKNGNSFNELSNGQFLMTMPLIEIEAQAGFLDNYTNTEYLNDTTQHSIVVDKMHFGKYVAFRVKGDSMDDNSKNAIPHGYVVATRELQREHWASKLRFKEFPYWVIYTKKSAHPLLKQIVKHNKENGFIKFHSLNDSPEYCDFELNVDDIQALFYVVDVTRPISNKNYY